MGTERSGALAKTGLSGVVDQFSENPVAGTTAEYAVYLLMCIAGLFIAALAVYGVVVDYLDEKNEVVVSSFEIVKESPYEMPDLRVCYAFLMPNYVPLSFMAAFWGAFRHILGVRNALGSI